MFSLMSDLPVSISTDNRSPDASPRTAALQGVFVAVLLPKAVHVRYVLPWRKRADVGVERVHLTTSGLLPGGGNALEFKYFAVLVTTRRWEQMVRMNAPENERFCQSNMPRAPRLWGGSDRSSP